ncbi:hypothetical protein F2Q69_00044321 [Brassica cretica]|uniref:Uncharacterized protein n=1 Tax=Brassica cretica TaxID=69181 RepID=A0A8S9NQJ0_BRACR|nr:hypothetical protein F2Q69_00044321 [Brassica cretica]
MLPGKSAMNPRVGHCNATELRCDKAEGKEPEQLSSETAPGAEERTEHSASSKVTAPDELAETPPFRVYVPKVPYPIPPKHLMDPISAEQLVGFTKMGWRTRMVVKSEPPVALRTIMYYLLLRHITISVLQKKNENKVMEKGKKEKKHEPRGRSSKRVGTKLKDWRAGR